MCYHLKEKGWCSLSKLTSWISKKLQEIVVVLCQVGTYYVHLNLAGSDWGRALEESLQGGQPQLPCAALWEDTTTQQQMACICTACM